MPLYDYFCACGNRFEALEFGKEIDIPHPCSKCGKEMQRDYCPSGNFMLKYDPKKDSVAWGSEGYNTTQRNKKVEDEN
jgi:putative FmdB family regulatory protein